MCPDKILENATLCKQRDILRRCILLSRSAICSEEVLDEKGVVFAEK